MRILLVNPSQHAIYGRGIAPPYAPLGPLYVAAALERAGHEVAFFDHDIDSSRGAGLSTLLSEFGPQIVGISTTTPTFGSAVRIARVAKHLSGSTVVLGGAHPSLAPEDVLRHEEVDVVVVGEGERTMVEVAGHLSRGDGSLEEIRGICYRQRGGFAATPARAPEPDLDAIPFPARHLVRNPDAYSPPDAIAGPFVTLLASRGCAHRCTFCSTPALFGPRVRRRTVANVMAEIEECVDRYGIREVHLADDCFTSDPEWVLRFCAGLAERELGLNLFFMNGLRADQVDRPLLSALKGVGLVNVGFGVESGSQTVLDRARKGLRLPRVEESLAIANELGLTTWAFFMIGLPGEDEGTVGDTVRMAKRLDPDFAKFFIFKPYPGSEAYALLDAQGLIFDRCPDHYGLYGPPVHRLPGLSESRLAHWFRRANIEFYLRPGKILRHLFRLRSLAQLRLNLRALRFLVQAVGRMGESERSLSGRACEGFPRQTAPTDSFREQGQ